MQQRAGPRRASRTRSSQRHAGQACGAISGSSRRPRGRFVTRPRALTPASQCRRTAVRGRPAGISETGGGRPVERRRARIPVGEGASEVSPSRWAVEAAGRGERRGAHTAAARQRPHFLPLSRDGAATATARPRRREHPGAEAAAGRLTDRGRGRPVSATEAPQRVFDSAPRRQRRGYRWPASRISTPCGIPNARPRCRSVAGDGTCCPRSIRCRWPSASPLASRRSR